MDAFVWAQHDPSAMLFGTHLFVIGEMVGFVMQTTLAVVGIVCGCVYSMLHAEYLATCCYSVYPPAALTVAVYGDCRDSGSLAYIGSNGGHCGYGMPATQVHAWDDRSLIRVVGGVADSDDSGVCWRCSSVRALL